VAEAAAVTALRRGLTLVEVIIAIVIIGVLVAVLLPFRHASRQGARRANCKSNLRQIGLACHLYADDNNGYFPNCAWRYPAAFDGYWPAAGSGLNALKMLYPTYVDNAKLFKCPPTQDDVTGFQAGTTITDKNGGSYAYDPRHKAAHAGSVVIAGDRLGKNPKVGVTDNHQGQGGNFLFADAHVSWANKPAGAALALDTLTDRDVWTPGAPGYEHDTCLVR
jgi:prepilin-type N-terminal cleavage/methylation domain-containing protein/prepilin-type processing-associated H-X9-DG protein